MKRSKNRAAFVWWMWLWAVLLFLPVLILEWQPISALVWAIMAVSAVFDTFYYRALVRAYESGDLSIVYPLARGTAPIFILFWSVLVLNERPSLAGVIGIGLIAAGLSTLNLPRFSAWRNLLKAFGDPAPRWALMAGFCTSLYTTVDRVGVGYISPLLYTCVTMTLMVICLTPGTLRSAGWNGLKQEFNASKFNIVLAGFVAMAAYVLVLAAMHRGLPTSYAGATREISVVFGAVAGMVWLNEQGSAMRVAGSVLIAAGAGTIAFLG